MPLNSFYFNITNCGIIVHDKCGVKQDYSFSVGQLEPGYCNAICINGNNKEEIDQDIIKLSAGELMMWMKQNFKNINDN